MAVLVTDGEQRSSLAVTRALGRAGIPVTVGASTQPSLAGSSRYCRQALRYPSPVRNPEEFVEFLQKQIQQGGYQVAMPMTDITTKLVASVRDAIHPVRLPIPSLAQLDQAQNKRAVLLLAQKLGIECPTTYMLHEQDRIETVAAGIRYPVVIKPVVSWYRNGTGWLNGAVQYAFDVDELTTKYRQAHCCIPRPLVQELVPGEGRGVFLLLWDGELKAAFCHRRLREKPPSGGLSVLSESVPLDHRLLERSLALLKAIGWQGVAMVEFKIDRRNGSAKLMEINGRFWGSLQLAIDAGINFPLMLYRLSNGQTVQPEFRYRVGVKTRWLLGDLDHLLIRLRRRENNLLSGNSSRLRACLDFMKFRQKDMYYEVLKFDDPRPGWVEIRQYVHSLLRAKEIRGAH
jgi:predicted ATP-grasp superfamily ATP-dependent carboligase